MISESAGIKSDPNIHSAVLLAPSALLAAVCYRHHVESCTRVYGVHPALL